MMLTYASRVPNTMSFGKWLKSHRTDKRLSGVDLEKRSGVSRQYISNLERDLTSEVRQKPIQPSADVVIKLAKALDADADEALMAAGYAPRLRTEKPISAIEALKLIEKLIPGFEGVIPSEGITDERAEELLNDFRRIAELHKRARE